MSSKSNDLKKELAQAAEQFATFFADLLIERQKKNTQDISKPKRKPNEKNRRNGMGV